MRRIRIAGTGLALGCALAAALTGVLAGPLLAQDKSGPDPAAPAAAAAAPAAEARHDPHLHSDMTVPKTAQLLTGYGDGGFAINQAKPAAAKFFNNGLELHAAFAHVGEVARDSRIAGAVAEALASQRPVAGGVGVETRERPSSL